MRDPLFSPLRFDHPDDEAVFVVVIARLCEAINPAIDSQQAVDVVEDFLNRKKLDFFNIVELAAMIRSECIFNPLKDTTH